MKKLLLLLVFAVFLSCKNEAPTPTLTPFEKSISEYVKTNFKDPSSYEKISIEVLDTVTVQKKIAERESFGLSNEHFESEPKDKFLYYTISHKYRANNSFGAKILYDDIVSMDKDFNITGSHAAE